MRRWLIAIFAVCLGLVLLAGPNGPASASGAPPDCSPNPHCYSQVGQPGYTPGATEVWTTLNTYCMTIEHGNFENNELWAPTQYGDIAGSEYLVEFGHKLTISNGVTLQRWFWARTVNGVEQPFYLSEGFNSGTVYNATIKYTGASGEWQFWQGGAEYGNGAGNWPTGPILQSIVGAEMVPGTFNDEQNSIYDGFNGGSGRVQSGVHYTGWGGARWRLQNIPPFDPSAQGGDAYDSDDNPNVGGVNGC